MQRKLCVVFPIEMMSFHLNWISYQLDLSFRVQMERGSHGLERVTVAKFPTKKYSDKFFAAAENSQYV